MSPAKWNKTRRKNPTSLLFRLSRSHNRHLNPSEVMSNQLSGGFTRRAFLRGVGACLALPTLELLLPTAHAATTVKTAATTASGLPLRMGFIAFANGSNYQRWLPRGEGREYELNETFAPMTRLKDKFQI